MKTLLSLSAIALLLSSCAHKTTAPQDTLVSIQTIDRNGLTETISAKERLKLYQNINYLNPQPYQKILRVFSKDFHGKSPSKITSYHTNGQPWQYLEAVDGRAHGFYREWFPSGSLRLEAEVIEGTADINELAQSSWVFNGTARVYQESGALEALIPYDKGLFQGIASYYFENGTFQKQIPYEKDGIHGEVLIYDPLGEVIEKITYFEGKKEGISIGYFDKDHPSYEEHYHKDLLITGKYYDTQGSLLEEVKEGSGKQLIYNQDVVASIVSIVDGKAEGRVEIYSPEGVLEKFYTIKEGKKNGEEVIYYPQKLRSSSLKPKISFFWQGDVLHGVVKTWYDSGSVESQKELCDNKKNGLSFAWYESGEMMLAEEYENDTLLKGSYFKKGQRRAVSEVEKGDGLATLFDKTGIFLKKITYERGKPIIDARER